MKTLATAILFVLAGCGLLKDDVCQIPQGVSAKKAVTNPQDAFGSPSGPHALLVQHCGSCHSSSGGQPPPFADSNVATAYTAAKSKFDPKNIYANGGLWYKGADSRTAHSPGASMRTPANLALFEEALKNWAVAESGGGGAGGTKGTPICSGTNPVATTSPGSSPTPTAVPLNFTATTSVPIPAIAALGGAIYTSRNYQYVRISLDSFQMQGSFIDVGVRRYIDAPGGSANGGSLQISDFRLYTTGSNMQIRGIKPKITNGANISSSNTLESIDQIIGAAPAGTNMGNPPTAAVGVPPVTPLANLVSISSESGNMLQLEIGFLGRTTAAATNTAPPADFATFETAVAPVLALRCNSCHANANNMGAVNGFSLLGSNRADRDEIVNSNLYNKTTPATSTLIQKGRGQVMHNGQANFAPLTVAAEITAIQNWMLSPNLP